MTRRKLYVFKIPNTQEVNSYNIDETKRIKVTSSHPYIHEPKTKEKRMYFLVYLHLNEKYVYCYKY